MTKPDRREGRRALPRRLGVAGALVLAMAGGWLAIGGLIPARGETMVVTMTPWCGCCGEWADHMRAAGFDVTVVETDALDVAKQAAAIPTELYSCHTAEIAGYVVEGHVPVPAIDKLLAERPAIDGIALAGMPPGSPGMGGAALKSYPVEAFRDGEAIGRFMDAPLR